MCSSHISVDGSPVAHRTTPEPEQADSHNMLGSFIVYNLSASPGRQWGAHPCMHTGGDTRIVLLLPLFVLAAVLISMSLGLQSLGVIDTLSGWAGAQLDALSLPWPALFAALHLTFFGAHYLFASQTAHVGALYAAFCSLMISSGGVYKQRVVTRARGLQTPVLLPDTYIGIL